MLNYDEENRINIKQLSELIYHFKDVDGADAYIAELRAIRAYWYYQLLDMFGNVPLSIDFEVTEALANSTRQQVYDFVKKELDEFLSYKFFPRFGGGIGVTRLMSALENCGVAK